MVLRWSEAKKSKISIPDNVFFLYLIIIKLCTLKQLENIHQKIEIKIFITVMVSMATIQEKLPKRALKALFLESLIKKYK